MSYETLEIDGKKIKKQIFAESIEEPDQIFEVAKFDGILGMGFSNIAVTGGNYWILWLFEADYQGPTPFESMINQRLVNDPLFSFYFSSNQEEGSEVTFGSINKEKFTGEINW